MDRISVTELGYVGFEVSDLGAWRGFAANVLGMEVVEEANGARLRMDFWHQRLVLHEGPMDDLAYAGFRVSGPDAFRGIQRQLAEAGVSFEVASHGEAKARHVLEFLRLEDPGGLPLEIFHGPRVDRHAPIRPGRGMYGKFLVGGHGLGHLVVVENDLVAAERFYRDALGMRGSVEARVDVGGQEIEPVFMHCNARGHSIAFGIPGIGKRVQHFMVEVDNLDDVGLARELAREHQVPILMDLGRHQNDQMVSFYVQTPSGFFCEYGWGGAHALDQSEYNARGDSWGHEMIDPSLLG
jgi:2,3-dihydroxyethylbenzene 1,2-dioxygenase